MRIVTPNVELVSVTADALRVIEAAGRVCYKSEDKVTDTSAPAFVRGLIKRGHESVIEHASATFKFVCDRGVSHEIVRHRLAGYSQESTRYCNYGSRGGEIAVVVPPFTNDADRQSWTEAMDACEQAYLSMIGRGCAPQLARSVLPNSLKTELFMTANFREWRHFLKLRTSSAAHPQMREVANMVLAWFQANYPVIVEDLA